MNSLSGGSAATQAASGRKINNPLVNLVLHPPNPVPEGQMDHTLSSLLRMMRLPEVVAADKATVKLMGGGDDSHPLDDEVTIREMEAIRIEHDARVDRAVRAVGMLRARYNWKRRITGELEPEELDPNTLDPAADGNEDDEDGSEEGSEAESDVEMEMVDAHDEAPPLPLSSVPIAGVPIINGHGPGESGDEEFEDVTGATGLGSLVDYR